MIYLLDTDTVTHAHRARLGVRERIDAARAAGDVVAVGLVTRIEVLSGRFEAVLKAADGGGIARAQELLRSSEEYLAQFPVIPFNEAAASEFDRLRDDKWVRKVGRKDFLIACTALGRNATVVTRNTKDFAHVPGLKLENWAD